jgi:hypothetical protein
MGARSSLSQATFNPKPPPPDPSGHPQKSAIAHGASDERLPTVWFINRAMSRSREAGQPVCARKRDGARPRGAAGPIMTVVVRAVASAEEGDGASPSSAALNPCQTFVQGSQRPSDSRSALNFEFFSSI